MWNIVAVERTITEGYSDASRKGTNSQHDQSTRNGHDTKLIGSIEPKRIWNRNMLIP